MNKIKKFNRYHADVYLPESFPEMILEFIKTFGNDIKLTDHAADEMYKDKRGMIPFPTKTEMLDNSNKIIEFYERQDRLDRIQKLAIRINHLSEKYDYTYVIAREGVLITCWCNDKTDIHRLTESRDEYYCPSEIKDRIYAKLDEKEKNYVKLSDR